MAKQSVDPTTLVIFGATGGLARERLIPALYHLFSRHLTSKDFTVLGFARSAYTHLQFRKLIKPNKPDKKWESFAKHVFYQSGNFTNEEDFHKIGSFFHYAETKHHRCANHVFYFSTLPSHYETISQQLQTSGLLNACRLHKRQVRIIVEKPFGTDLISARKLDQTLSQFFTEDQIYRIDHYLAKETVQNLFTIRFANSIFEPVWNKNYIDHIEISALEQVGVEKRGTLYEQSGAIRDVMQNHLLQLLALTTIERPVDLSSEAIRDERVKIIKSIRQMSPKEIKNNIIIGQYRGYRNEKNVDSKSNVETFAAIKLFIDNERWQGVPFYLRTGKKMNKKMTEISVHFKPPVHLFKSEELIANVLTFQIHDNDAGVYFNFLAKYPGTGIRLHPVLMKLSYDVAFHEEIPGAYERLLLDFLQGDQRLFARSDEIEHSWKYIDSIIKHLPRTPYQYETNESGPNQAHQFIKKEKRDWWTK